MSANVVEAFRNALISQGIIPPAHLLADDQLHRCDSEGKNGKKDAAYVLHLDGLPAGGFENHCDGQGWQNWHVHINSNLSEAEKADYHAKLAAISQQRQVEKRRREQQGRATAQRLWVQAKPCNAHSYLSKKTVQAGLSRAQEAAQSVNSLVAVPDFGASGPVHATDFNDLHQHSSLHSSSAANASDTPVIHQRQ